MDSPPGALLGPNARYQTIMSSLRCTESRAYAERLGTGRPTCCRAQWSWSEVGLIGCVELRKDMGCCKSTVLAVCAAPAKTVLLAKPGSVSSCSHAPSPAKLTSHPHLAHQSVSRGPSASPSGCDRLQVLFQQFELVEFMCRHG